MDLSFVYKEVHYFPMLFVKDRVTSTKKIEKHKIHCKNTSIDYKTG